MLRFIYFIYFLKFEKNETDRFFHRVMIRFANKWLSWYFKITGRFTTQRMLPKAGGDDKVIVSLTSYPARIHTLWMVIETLLAQSYKPDKIILWLYSGEYESKESLPENLRKLARRGLDIRFCEENLYPHKKYYYSMLEYPDSIIITVDDDMLFHPDMIKNLMECHNTYPQAICCSILRRMKFRGEKYDSYNTWEYVHINTEPSFRNHVMGGGGTLFPPGSLHNDLFNIEKIRELSLKTDDLWLKVMSLKQYTKVASVAGHYARFFIPVIIKNDNPLMDHNVKKNNNDKNFNRLVDYYGLYTADFRSVLMAKE